MKPKESPMKVKEAMHKGIDWVGPDTPITELAKLMLSTTSVPFLSERMTN